MQQMEKGVDVKFYENFFGSLLTNATEKGTFISISKLWEKDNSELKPGAGALNSCVLEIRHRRQIDRKDNPW